MSGKTFYAKSGMGLKVKGTALVAKDGFSARYDLDRINGVFSRPEHKLAGENYNGRILILDAAKVPCWKPDPAAAACRAA